MESEVLMLKNYLLALSDRPSRIERAFFSLLTEGANTTDWNQSNIENVNDNRGTNELKIWVCKDYLLRKMVAIHISECSLQRHVQHKSASRSWRPAQKMHLESQTKFKKQVH